MQYNVKVIGALTEDQTIINAPSGLGGETDAVSVTQEDLVAVLGGVSEPLMGLELTIAGVAPQPGDTIVVVGAPGVIPDYQVGMMLVVDEAGLAHFPNAGHLAAAFSLG